MAETTKTGLKAAIIPVTAFQQNCTLLWNPDTMLGAVVDPGGNLDAILKAVDELGIKVEKILLTHGHIDHAGGAADLRDDLSVKIEGPHKAEKPLLENLETQGDTYGMETRNFTPDRWLEEGDTVTVGGHTFDVLHCPGHSPGSVVFVNKAQRFALMGDVLFQGSVGRTDLPMGDHATLMDSLKTKILPLDDNIVFICGHGPMSSIGAERASNPFLLDLA